MNCARTAFSDVKALVQNEGHPNTHHGINGGDGLSLMGMGDDKHRYWPRMIEEIDDNGLSIINEPIRDVVPLRPVHRPLHAVLVEALTNTQGLITRLESGVHVPRDGQREVVRELYVQTRRQLKGAHRVLGA
jgi:hypothetical protein